MQFFNQTFVFIFHSKLGFNRFSEAYGYLRKKAKQTRFTRQKNRTTDLIYKSNKISISIHQATYSYTFALSVDRFIYSRSSKLSIRILTVDV
jgi:hypothetical protein